MRAVVLRAVDVGVVARAVEAVARRERFVGEGRDEAELVLRELALGQGLVLAAADRVGPRRELPHGGLAPWPPN